MSFEAKEITAPVDGVPANSSWANGFYEVRSLNYHLKFYVGVGTMRCCGMGHIQKISNLLASSDQIQQEVFNFLKKSFGPTTKEEGRVSGYKHNQLFCTHADGVLEKYPLFMKNFNVRKEMTWQSASEPYHRTALYSINFV